MSRSRRRIQVLVALFVGLAVVGYYLLSAVMATVFFAITVAYVIYPVRRWLYNRGLGRRVAAGLATLLAFLIGVLLLAPLAVVLYLRWDNIVEFLGDIPDSFTIDLGEFSYTITLEELTSMLSEEGAVIAQDLASAAPALALKAFLFTLLVYALLLRPGDLRTALLRPVPGGYHDMVERFHTTVRETLFAIYVLQAATAFGTFVIALLLFFALGYGSAFSFAVVAGILQFIPILGPSILIAVLAVLEVMADDVGRALAVTGLGLFFIGFLPDAVIRPRLAAYTTGMPGSLYFVGFVGGILSVGVVGVIAGPLVVALLADVARQLADAQGSTQEQLETD